MPLPRRPRHSADDTAQTELMPVIADSGLEDIPPTVALPLVPGLGAQPRQPAVARGHGGLRPWLLNRS